LKTQDTFLRFFLDICLVIPYIIYINKANKRDKQMTNTVNIVNELATAYAQSAADLAQQAIEATCEDEQEDFESAANNALEKHAAMLNVLARVQEDTPESTVAELVSEVGDLDTMLRDEVLDDIEFEFE
jgi:hypothetical protein